jgi:ElaB/YqjD/DUF883 family membrane-anchored ribosome-binding protein
MLGRNGALHSPMRNLRKDLHHVARDAEELLRATADVTNDRVQEARARAQKTVSHALDTLHGQRLQRRVRQYARYTDTYVRNHSWPVIGAVAGIALIVGLLARRD